MTPEEVLASMVPVKIGSPVSGQYFPLIGPAGFHVCRVAGTGRGSLERAEMLVRLLMHVPGTTRIAPSHMERIAWMLGDYFDLLSGIGDEDAEFVALMAEARAMHALTVDAARHEVVLSGVAA